MKVKLKQNQMPVLVSLLGHPQLVTRSQQKWELLIQGVSKVPNLPWSLKKAAELNRIRILRPNGVLVRSHPC